MGGSLCTPGKVGPDLQGRGRDGSSPLNVILIRLVGLVGSLNVVSLAHHSNVALHVALQPRRDVVRVGQDGPLVMELVLCGGEKRGLPRLALLRAAPTLGTGCGGQVIRSWGPGATFLPASGPGRQRSPSKGGRGKVPAPAMPPDVWYGFRWRNLLIGFLACSPPVPNPFGQPPHGCQTKLLKRPSLSHSLFQTHLRLPSAWGKDC